MLPSALSQQKNVRQSGQDALPPRVFGASRQEPLPPRLSGLPPAITANCTTLILGSFPSAASLDARQYYAHPQNRFWPLLGDCLGLDLAGLTYRARITALNAAGIGVWDAYASCERSGSLDSAIRNPAFNDFALARRKAPGLTRACFNGATAARAIRHLQTLGFETCVLPSTSPANASQPLAYKLAQWRAGLGGDRHPLPVRP